MASLVLLKERIGYEYILYKKEASNSYFLINMNHPLLFMILSNELTF